MEEEGMTHMPGCDIAELAKPRKKRSAIFLTATAARRKGPFFRCIDDLQRPAWWADASAEVKVGDERTFSHAQFSKLRVVRVGLGKGGWCRFHGA